MPWKFESNITSGDEVVDDEPMLSAEELVGYASLVNRLGLGIGR